MKNRFALYKSAIYTLLIDPLFYISSIATILFCSFRFFFSHQFFIEGIGTTDLREFFQSIPYISILTIPLLVFRNRNFIIEDSLPFSSTKRFLSVIFASFSSFAIPLLFLISIPISVNAFGDVDIGQVISGFLGIFLYGFCAISLVTLLFASLNFSPAVPLLISMMILAIVDFIHLVPLYFQIGSVFTFLLQKISFAWHFDSFGKGILDSRNIFFYILSTLILILISVFFEYKRTEKKISKLTVLLFSLTFFFLGFSSEKLYLRTDFTKNQQFTVSSTSKNLISNLSSPLRITYYRSKELKDLYPQSSDVVDYLQDFCAVSKNLTLQIETADPDKLSKMRIQGQQIQSSSETKMEFVTVYSAVVLQYLEKQTIIPFVLSTDTLEYDLAQRIQQLVTENYRKLLIIAGNGRKIEESYMYVAPLLSSRGFMTEIAELDENTVFKIDSLTSSDELLILGSSELTFEQSQAIENAMNKNVPTFVATSPYSVPVEDAWEISKNKNDTLLPILTKKGFAFGRSLVQDLSCFPLAMQSGEGNATEYVTVNYPLWVSVLPQESAKRGCTVFWASPLILYENAKPILQTTDFAWLQNESDSEKMPFLSDPFTLPKSAKASDSQNGKYILAATTGKITVISDQYFVHSLMTGFISGEKSVDFRNYDFLSTQLLHLRGDSQIADLMEKSKSVKTLYKITDLQEFLSERTKTIFVNFILLPIIFVALFIFVQLKRKMEKFQ